MKILCVKVGEKYSSSIVNNLYHQLSKFNNIQLYCLTDNYSGLHSSIIPIFIEKKDNWKKLQWHKTTFFRSNFNDFENGTEVIVIDIDQKLIDFTSILNYPYNKFCAFRRWWMTEYGEMSGGLYKFRIGDFPEVDIKFTPEWQEYWVKNKMVRPPVNGEQNYVEMMLGKNIEYMPNEWCTKWTTSNMRNSIIEKTYYLMTGDLLKFNDEWNENLKIIHYAGTSYI